VSLLVSARRAFYRAGGPWYRNRLFEAAGSRRYSRPALHDMDRKLEELLPDGPGTFVEAGAHDGYTQSNTYYLERFRGWHGLLVEAVPELHAKARKRRPGSHVAQAALVGPDHAGGTVPIRFGDLMSTVGGDEAHAAAGASTAGRRAYEVDVPARTLSALLDDAGIESVDLLVLDVEGHELDALRGLDLNRHAPRLILVEMLDMARQRPQFDAFLGERYAFDRALSDWDALYRLR
jgi:FkbM family methyltransferase